MNAGDEKKIDRITEDLMVSFRFLRRVSREDLHPGAKRFDPSRFVLAAVMAHGPLPMSEIGKRMGFSKPYMTALIDRLIEEGLVERTSDKEDRRVVMIGVTQAGKESFRQFKERVRDSIKKTLSTLSSEDITSLYEAMESIVTIVSKLDQHEDDECSR